jgi:cation-transporting ATPase 13A1
MDQDHERFASSGDLCLIDQPILCPSDFMVMDGRAAVKEAILTGESTPQVKDPITSLPPDTPLDKNQHQRNIIFGGTRIEQLLPGKTPRLPAPGVVGQVLSTGQSSSQGRLIGTILSRCRLTAALWRQRIRLIYYFSSQSLRYWRAATSL